MTVKPPHFNYVMYLIQSSRDGRGEVLTVLGCDAGTAETTTVSKLNSDFSLKAGI